jgi:hypothetical protein
MAAACDGDECDPPPAAMDLAGRELQPPGPLPEAQLPGALPPRTAGRAATLNRSPASPQPSTPAIARTQRRPTSRTRAGRNMHEDVGAAVARAGRPQRNKIPKLNSEASKPSRLSNTRQEPGDSACPTLLRSAAVPGSVSPRGRQLQRLVGHRLVKPKTPFWIWRTFSASRSRESACPTSSPNVPPRHGRAAGHSKGAGDREEEQRRPPLTGQPFNDGGSLRRG